MYLVVLSHKHSLLVVRRSTSAQAPAQTKAKARAPPTATSAEPERDPIDAEVASNGHENEWAAVDLDPWVPSQPRQEPADKSADGELHNDFQQYEQPASRGSSPSTWHEDDGRDFLHGDGPGDDSDGNVTRYQVDGSWVDGVKERQLNVAIEENPTPAPRRRKVPCVDVPHLTPRTKSTYQYVRVPLEVEVSPRLDMGSCGTELSEQRRPVSQHAGSSKAARGALSSAQSADVTVISDSESEAQPASRKVSTSIS